MKELLPDKAIPERILQMKMIQTLCINDQLIKLAVEHQNAGRPLDVTILLEKLHFNMIELTSIADLQTLRHGKPPEKFPNPPRTPAALQKKSKKDEEEEEEEVEVEEEEEEEEESEMGEEEEEKVDDDEEKEKPPKKRKTNL